MNISGFPSGNPEIRHRIAREVAIAVETIGFLTIRGHGVPAQIMAAMRDKFQAFYDLPMEEKLKSVNPTRNLLLQKMGL